MQSNNFLRPFSTNTTNIYSDNDIDTLSVIGTGAPSNVGAVADSKLYNSLSATTTLACTALIDFVAAQNPTINFGQTLPIDNWISAINNSFVALSTYNTAITNITNGTTVVGNANKINNVVIRNSAYSYYNKTPVIASDITIPVLSFQNEIPTLHSFAPLLYVYGGVQYNTPINIIYNSEQNIKPIYVTNTAIDNQTMLQFILRVTYSGNSLQLMTSFVPLQPNYWINFTGVDSSIKGDKFYFALGRVDVQYGYSSNYILSSITIHDINLHLVNYTGGTPSITHGDTSNVTINSLTVNAIAAIYDE